VRLLLEGALRLDGQLGRHDCEDSVDTVVWVVERGGELLGLSTSRLRKICAEPRLKRRIIECGSCAMLPLVLIQHGGTRLGLLLVCLHAEGDLGPIGARRLPLVAAGWPRRALASSSHVLLMF
jgi:hypothetical protein